MTVRQKQVRYNIYAFLLLFFVSLYRQLSLRYMPDDPFRSYILYGCYIILMAVWGISIHARVTQKMMRVYIFLEEAVFFSGLTLRFIQDAFLYEDVLLMRVSGLFIAATCLPVTLLGLYAALGIGRADSYRFPGKWYALLIPVTILLLMTVNDEKYHFFFYIIPEEPQPNLSFHPYIGVFVMYFLAAFFMVIRVSVIYKRNKIINQRRFLYRLIPFFEPIILLVATIPYFVVSLQLIPSLASMEIIELYAKMYYVEVLTWEFYIYVGLVPVNTDYQEIFEHSAAMQIIDNDGNQIVSKNAIRITPDMLNSLKIKGYDMIQSGKELHIHHLSGAYFIWNKDVVILQNTIEELNRSAETLAQEGILLKEELKTKNNETGLMVQNRIYDELTGEVSAQIRLMKEVIKKRDSNEENTKLLQQLLLLGTYGNTDLIAKYNSLLE